MVLLSPTQVAELYGYSTSQIRRLIRKGVIKAQKIGAFYVIDQNNLKDLKAWRERSNADE